MALVKHQIECTECEKESIVISDDSNEVPGFCPHCGVKLSEEPVDEDKDE